MKYAQAFDLKCHAVINEYFSEKANNIDGDLWQSFPIDDFDQHIRDLFDAEMVERGVPKSYSWMIFKKKGYPLEDPATTHVDTVNEIARVSIVIPLMGCEETHMYWCEGEHTITQVPKHKEEMTYGVPVWEDISKVKIVHREFINSPTICRVDVPHNTVTRADDSYRIVITTRFQNNPTFEEVCEKLGK